MIPFDPKLAWWFLTKEQRKLLASQRYAGGFGGIPGHAPYWWLQETETYPKPPGFSTPKSHFIEKTRPTIRERARSTVRNAIDNI